MLCPSTLAIRIRLFYHPVLLICIYAIIWLVLLTINFLVSILTIRKLFIVHCKAPLSRFYPEKGAIQIFQIMIIMFLKALPSADILFGRNFHNSVNCDHIETLVRALNQIKSALFRHHVSQKYESMVFTAKDK